MRPQLLAVTSSLLRSTTARLYPSSPLAPLSALILGHQSFAVKAQPQYQAQQQVLYTSQTTANMSATPINANSVLDLIKNRRTYYPLSKDLPISKERISEIVKEAVLHVPSSFNAQSNRVIVLLGADHEKLWDIATDILKAIVPAEAFKATADKMGMFKGAAGTVLFFEDEKTVQKQQSDYPYVRRQVPRLGHAVGRHAAVRHLDRARGRGRHRRQPAALQPLINEKVAAEWNVPSDWKLNAQLVFGGKTGEAGPKSQIPVEERVKVFGA
ncbi:nitroreductase [Apiospora hydei]|uniref:Nitroreductase n=1 Tax=Apiospora hydei TaxID=1337664 RepID=A0ABR1V7B1_9PEZI